MREIPMLFSGSMVRAILDRQKRVTRRVVPIGWRGKRAAIGFIGGRGEEDDPSCWGYADEYGDYYTLANDDPQRVIPSPYGGPGNFLWVKETWRPEVAHSHGENSCDCGDVAIRYHADGAERFVSDRDIPGEWTMPKAAKRGNVTPLFMPRWASRLTLDVVSSRVERLHSITEEDARAEGAMSWALESERNQDRWAHWTKRLDSTARVGTARGAFFALWESINGAESIAANPWVWVVDFGIHEALGEVRA